MVEFNMQVNIDEIEIIQREPQRHINPDLFTGPIDEEIQQEPRRPRGIAVHTDEIPMPKDSMKREIRPGDVLCWTSAKFYSTFINYGVVLSINVNSRSIRIRNHNKNNVTIWNTYGTTILARIGDYSLITDELKERLGIEEF